jgi:hypothetical protein
VSPHEFRVVEELKELQERLDKLDSFMGTPTYEGLPGEERGRLIRQFDIMGQYAGVLEERVCYFKTANANRKANSGTPEVNESGA